jgi:glycine cleavage system H lipoate-binding protein
MIKIIGITTIVNNHLHDLLFATLTSQNRQIDKQVVAAENVNVSEALYDVLCYFATTFFLWIFHSFKNSCK